MDSQPTVPTPSQQPAVSSDNKTSNSGKRMAVKGLGGVLSVLIIAGVTYGILSATMGQKSSDSEKIATVKEAETPTTIDAQVQSYMSSEQKLETALSDSESQTVVDEVDSAQSLEGSYDSF